MRNKLEILEEKAREYARKQLEYIPEDKSYDNKFCDRSRAWFVYSHRQFERLMWQQELLNPGSSFEYDCGLLEKEYTDIVNEIKSLRENK